MKRVEIEELKELRKSYLDLKDTFMSLLNQACQSKWNNERDWPEFDHMCIGAYEDAIEFALERGWINEEQVTR